MNLDFTVSCVVSHTQGKFAGSDELADQIKDALEGADPGSLEGEGGGEYTIDDWSVDLNEQPRSGSERATMIALLKDCMSVVATAGDFPDGLDSSVYARAKNTEQKVYAFLKRIGA